MTLREKQSIFVRLVAKLINFAYMQDYELTFGETYRSPEESLRLYNLGKGIKNSLHTQRLAIDLNLFKSGKYLVSTEDHRLLGEYWESLSTNEYECVWGGRFSDGNHHSIKHGNRR